MNSEQNISSDDKSFIIPGTEINTIKDSVPNLIDGDCKKLPLKIFSENPTKTIFKKVYSERPTHYNKWTQIFDFGLSKNIHIDNLYSKNIHVYNDLSLILTLDSSTKLSIDVAFEHITNITFKMKNLVTLDLSGSVIHEIIRTDHKNIKKINSIFKHKNQLVIPLQTLISPKDSFFPTNHDIDISFETRDNFVVNASVGLVCAYLTSEENRRFQSCHHEYMSNRYYVESHKVENTEKIPIPVLLPIKTIIVVPERRNFQESSSSNNNNILINLEFREFNKSSYNYFSDGIDINSNSYYLNSMILHDNFTKNIPTGKIIAKNKNLFLDIKSDKPTEITIIYCCHDYLRMYTDSMGYGGCLRNREHNNFYPLTKVSDNEFIEGYWFPDEDPSDTDYDISYPKPLATNNPVPIEFINKLQLLTDTEAKKDSFWGSSSCRLCHCANGADEYTLTSNNLKYIYPSGLMHYYTEHNVQPSKEFYNFVMDYF